MNPTLRPISFDQQEHEGQPIWVLRDPMNLAEEQICLPLALARMVSQCDGSNSAEQLHQLLCTDTQQDLPFEIITNTLNQLDELYLLENSRSQAAIDAMNRSYHNQPFRPPAFAGINYPDKPQPLDEYLAHFSKDDAELKEWPGWNGRAIIAPHIDFQRGGPVYGKVWQRAKEAIDSAEICLIFGTDHNGGAASLTLSQLPYATPYGTLPTDPEIVNALAQSIGEDEAYKLELNHRNEHSIEFSAVWFHYLRQHNPCPVIPILVGSFYHFTPHQHPGSDEKLMRFIETLQRVTQGKRVLSVASVDLAHVGPAFDSNYLMDNRKREELAKSDLAIREAIMAGDSESFYQQIAKTRNANNICGFSPIYMMLRYLNSGGNTCNASDIAYDQCEADEQNTSVVSICGMLID